MSIFFRLIYRFNVIPSKTLAGFLEENDKMIKIYLEIFLKKNKVGKLTLLGFKPI